MYRALTVLVLAILMMIPVASTAQAQLDPGGGYRYTFPVSPTLETVRRMMLNGCVIVVYPKTWVCPDAPPYTYGH